MLRDLAQAMRDTWPLLFAWQPWMGPGATLLFSVVLGLTVEKLLLSLIRQILRHTSMALNEQIAATMRGVIFWIFALWGAYMATYTLHFLEPEHVVLVRQSIFALVMLMSISLLAKVAVAIARFYLNHSNSLQALPNTSIFENIIRVTVYILGILMLLQTLGISIVPIMTALGVGGLAVSLALQDTLANLFAGIQMILARQIKVGNTIQLENGQIGEVVDIAWRTTTLRQLAGNLVILPNSKMAANIIVNHRNPHPDLTVTLQVAIPLNADLQRVEDLSQEVAQNVGQMLLKLKGSKSNKPIQFTPVIRYVSYGESWVNMAISMPFTVFMDAGLVRHELFKALHERYLAEGISLPFPQQIIHVDAANRPSDEENRPGRPGRNDAEWLEKIVEQSGNADDE